MIVPPETADAIAAGELDTIVGPDPLSVGKVHAIQVKTGQRARCHVEITERWRDKDRWHHRFVLVPRPHVGHYLHRNPGAGRMDYTSSPGQAMRGEGEAPSKDDMALQKHLAHINALRDRQERRIVQEQLPLEKRIAAYQHEAKRKRIDIRSEVRLIGRLKQQGKRIDNVVEGIRRKIDSDLDRAA